MTSKKTKPTQPVKNRQWRRLKIIGPTLLVAGIITHVALALFFDFTQDDAFITFRYAENFINGHGLVYNIGERIEGYTNFLWLVFMILGRLIGFEYVIFSKVLGVLFGIGTIVATYLFAQRIYENKPHLSGLTTLILGSVYSFGYWAVAGLETSAFAFCIMASFYFYMRGSLVSLFIAVLATLFRPEGGLLIMFIIFHNILSNKKITSYAIKSFFLVSLLLAPYAIFKVVYFGALLPNPFYAKTDFSIHQLANGWEYVSLYYYHYIGGGLFLLPAILFFRKLQPHIRMILSFVLVYSLYIFLIGGDVLKVHRFFLPIMPLMAITIIYGISKIFKRQLLIAGFAVGIIGWQLYFPFKHVSTFHITEQQLHYKMNEMTDRLLKIDSTNFSIATSTIGLVGYRLIDNTVIDLLGLTDSTIARHPEKSIKNYQTTWKESKYNAKYVISRKPDYILFSTDFKPSAPAEMALFTYSQFLDNYRTISFFFAGTRRELYKKVYPIKGDIIANVDPSFVNLYTKGINYGIAGDNRNAAKSFRQALKYSPKRKYPYLYYQISVTMRNLGDFEGAYKLLQEIVKEDTLIFAAYDDLNVFEVDNGNLKKAEEYKQKIISAMPWKAERFNRRQAELIRTRPEKSP